MSFVLACQRHGRSIALTHGAGVARVLGVVAERSGITVRGNVVEFASSYSKNQYDASMRRLRQLENRVEMLELAIGQSSRDDLAKLTQR